MALQEVTREELEGKLEHIINVLVKKGLLPVLSPEAKKDLVNKVSNTLTNDPHVSLSKEDLKNDNIQTALGVACMAQLLHLKNPDYKFNYSLLFKPQFEIEPKELQKELKLLFTNVLKLNPSYQNKPFEEKALIEADIHQLTKDMSKQLQDNNELLLKNDYLTKAVSAGIDLLSEHRRQLYGVDTHVAGEIPKPVFGVPLGEQMGFREDLTASDKSFMGQRDTANASIPDELGMHMAAVINYLADGDPTASEKYLMDNHILPNDEPTMTSPTPFSTKPPDPYH